MAVKKLTRTTTTTTEIIIDGLSGREFIINRNTNVNQHYEFLTDKNVRDKKMKEWIDLDNYHKEEMTRDNKELDMVAQAEAGEAYALKYIVSLHKEETADEFGVKNIWWEATLSYLKDRALTWIIGALRGLVKDQIPNMVKFASWLVEQLEDTIINQYNRLGDEQAKALIRNELSQYEEFKRLADKMK